MTLFDVALNNRLFQPAFLARSPQDSELRHLKSYRIVLYCVVMCRIAKFVFTSVTHYTETYQHFCQSCFIWKFFHKLLASVAESLRNKLVQRSFRKQCMIHHENTSIINIHKR